MRRYSIASLPSMKKRLSSMFSAINGCRTWSTPVSSTVGSSTSLPKENPNRRSKGKKRPKRIWNGKFSSRQRLQSKSIKQKSKLSQTTKRPQGKVVPPYLLGTLLTGAWSKTWAKHSSYSLLYTRNCSQFTVNWTQPMFWQINRHRWASSNDTN